MDIDDKKPAQEKTWSNDTLTNLTVFNWRHLRDSRLYSDNDYAVRALATGLDLQADGFINENTSEDKINFHCFWYGKVGPKQIFSMKSFLITQDLKKAKLILWLDILNGYDNYKENEHLQSLLPFIEVRSYNPLFEVKGTEWEHHEYIADYRDSYHNLVKRADAFRFLILNKYGGVYFDLDIMFLKDLSPLLSKEFCYAWEIQPYANSAVFNIKQRSEMSNYLLKKCLIYNSVSPWEIFKYEDFLLKNLFVLPCAFFDPIWQGLNTENSPCKEFSDFFRPFSKDYPNRLKIKSFKNFYPGCYTFHWHNQWDSPEFENSFFGIFAAEISTYFSELQLPVN